MRNALCSHESNTWQWVASLLTSTVLWCYSAWVTWIFCQHSRRLPHDYILWLLLTVLLAVKTFAFSPVADGAAIRTLLFALLAEAVLMRYFKRSQHVKSTFIEP
ncbi:inner membrane protein YdgK [Candidatus Erwinia dacicola]|uniref:Inner membrane protein YdgK n=1 Tax=Candidatus Erwinia dacicola TaxID=252393 RepID=A0A328TNZ2_9GAMM|nr:inner membrane protein YdgK [Candidatus Erwinia dacicola]